MLVKTTEQNSISDRLLNHHRDETTRFHRKSPQTRAKWKGIQKFPTNLTARHPGKIYSFTVIVTHMANNCIGMHNN